MKMNDYLLNSYDIGHFVEIELNNKNVYQGVLVDIDYKFVKLSNVIFNGKAFLSPELHKSIIRSSIKKYKVITDEKKKLPKSDSYYQLVNPLWFPTYIVPAKINTAKEDNNDVEFCDLMHQRQQYSARPTLTNHSNGFKSIQTQNKASLSTAEKYAGNALPFQRDIIREVSNKQQLIKNNTVMYNSEARRASKNNERNAGKLPTPTKFSNAHSIKTTKSERLCAASYTENNCEELDLIQSLLEEFNRIPPPIEEHAFQLNGLHAEPKCNESLLTTRGVPDSHRVVSAYSAGNFGRSKTTNIKTAAQTKQCLLHQNGVKNSNAETTLNLATAIGKRNDFMLKKCKSNIDHTVPNGIFDTLSTVATQSSISACELRTKKTANSHEEKPKFSSINVERNAFQTECGLLLPAISLGARCAIEFHSNTVGLTYTDQRTIFGAALVRSIMKALHVFDKKIRKNSENCVILCAKNKNAIENATSFGHLLTGQGLNVWLYLGNFMQDNDFILENNISIAPYSKFFNTVDNISHMPTPDFVCLSMYPTCATDWSAEVKHWFSKLKRSVFLIDPPVNYKPPISKCLIFGILPTLPLIGFDERNYVELILCNTSTPEFIIRKFVSNYTSPFGVSSFATISTTVGAEIITKLE